MLAKPPTCSGCALEKEGLGFMTPDGYPELGVVLMGEALGEQEAKEGRPFRGAAGVRLGKMIERAGYRRAQFLLTNAVWCQPPKNREPAPWEISHCKRHWQPTLLHGRCLVPMGNSPLSALTEDKGGILSRRGYVEWSEEHQAFLLPTVHPSFIMRGNGAWESAFVYDLRHAVEVAREGWTPIERDYVLDPSPYEAERWVHTFLQLLAIYPTLALSYDLETPDKGDSEDEIDINLGYIPGKIDRCGYAYIHPRTGKTTVLSMVWDPNFKHLHRALLESVGPKVVCYRHFDNPRIGAHGIEIRGDKHDMQEMWHCLFPANPKSLEHTTPFLCPRQPRWKHLNCGETRAYYNGVDAGVEVESYYRLTELLKQSGAWTVYERDVFGLNPLLIRMSAEGMPVDDQTRQDTSIQLKDISDGLQLKLNDIAAEVKPTKLYKKYREGLEETTYTQSEAYCTECGKKANKKHIHFKCGEAPGEVPLGELGQREVSRVGYIQPLDFTPSPKGLINYATAKGYRLITRWDKAEGRRKTPMDETAIRLYALRNPLDPLWPVVLEDREVGKLLSTYVGLLRDGKWEGGLRVNPKTGRVHTTFKHDPSTLRLSSAGPNMQNIPRGSTILGKLIRKMFRAGAGHIFWARDFSGIEAVLVGFFANAPRIIRIFKLDGHSFFTAYAIYELEKDHGGLTYADLPQEKWSDADLQLCLKGIKSRFKEQRNHNKKITHGANYMETAAMAQIILLNEMGVLYPVKDISRVMEFYHELFPEIRRWHRTVVAQVAGAPLDIQPQAWGFKARNCVITSPFGFPNRYYDTIRWEKGPTGWEWTFADEAKSLISFLPQHTARIILTRSVQRMDNDGATEDVARTFRLLIHDEVLGECKTAEVERCLQVSQDFMEQPVPELVLPDGTLLSLGTEAKVGPVWGDMQ